MPNRFIRAFAALLTALLVPMTGQGSITAIDSSHLPSDLPALEAYIAANPTNNLALIRTALEYHNKAAFGGKVAKQLVQQTKDCLNKVLQVEPTNAFAKALLGSVVVVSAREPFWPLAKIRRVRDGIVIMDEAIAMNPNDADARFTRASNNLFLPDFFNRRDVVEEDFQWLQSRADRGEFPVEFRQYVFLYHGLARKRWDEKERAESLWKTGLAINPNTKVADELRKELAGKSALSILDKE
ncbi:MAG: tetratricopeptide repeat protein [Limisphaerales bacterium]